MTTVVIELERGLLAYYLHRYDVIIDGEAYGRLNAGQSIAVQLAPGEHSVKFCKKLMQSPILKVFVGYHRTRITGRRNMWRAMGMFELFAPEEWARVREETDPGRGSKVKESPERQKQPHGVKAAPVPPRSHYARPEHLQLQV